MAIRLPGIDQHPPGPATIAAPANCKIVINLLHLYGNSRQKAKHPGVYSYDFKAMHVLDPDLPRKQMSHDPHNDEKWMRLALKAAAAAAQLGEVPVGAVLTHDHRLIAAAGNQPIGTCDPTAHAEIRVLREAARQLGNYRLPGTTLYVTLEPCLMCIGAIIHARVDRLVYGAADPKTGAVHSLYAIGDDSRLNHSLDITSGLLATECGDLLRTFFRERRRP